MHFEIGRDGCIVNCRLAPPSGIRRVDNKVCRLFSTRVHFRPGRGKHGRARVSNFSFEWGWTIDKVSVARPEPPALPTGDGKMPAAKAPAANCPPLTDDAAGTRAIDRPPGCR